MTTDQKMRYLDDIRKLVVKATTYEEALSHATFMRGMLAAWHADMSISSEQYRTTHGDLEVILEVKRKLPSKNEGVGF